MSVDIRYSHTTVPAGVDVHWASAGPADAPVVLLLHGYPTSSAQFRKLIPLLAGRYRVIAPDLPGFGFTKPVPGAKPSFDAIAEVVIQLLDALSITTFAMYVFDYGAPTGFRIALQRPEAVKAIISQNGNVYEEGLDMGFWGPLDRLWKTPEGTPEFSAQFTELLDAHGLEQVKWQYISGVPTGRLPLIDPTSYALDYHLNLKTLGQQEYQTQLFYDYRTNVASYPKWQEYLRTKQPPVLAIWGKGDPCFASPGAEAYRRDVPGAKVMLLDGGHFLLETHVSEVAKEILTFLEPVF